MKGHSLLILGLILLLIIISTLLIGLYVKRYSKQHLYSIRGDFIKRHNEKFYLDLAIQKPKTYCGFFNKKYTLTNIFEILKMASPYIPVNDALKKAKIYLGNGKIDKAKEILKNALILEPYNRQSLLLLGFIYYISGQYNKIDYILRTLAISSRFKRNNNNNLNFDQLEKIFPISKLLYLATLNSILRTSEIYNIPYSELSILYP